MITEDHIVPYQVSGLPQGPWLIFAPHADDETFGMGGTLLRAVAQGIHVELVIMTDGALGGSRNDLVAIRQREALQVAEFMGVAKTTFLGEPDRGLAVSDALVARLAELIQTASPACVFFPGIFEPHPDHRATALLIWQALGSIPSFRLPLALGYDITVQNPVNCLIDITETMAEKLKAGALYQSQTGENNYLSIIEALNKSRTFSLPESVKYAEGFYLYPAPAGARPLREVMLEMVAKLL